MIQLNKLPYCHFKNSCITYIFNSFLIRAEKKYQNGKSGRLHLTFAFVF
jgi:hypothetical protein